MIKVLCLYMIAGIFIYIVLKQNNINIDRYRYMFMGLILFVLLNLLNIDHIYYVVIITMISIMICDFRYYIIPDMFHVILIINRLLYINSIYELYISLISVLIIVLTIYMISIILNRLLHKQTIGGGDIKLFFSLGIYCSYMVNICCMMISCVMALIYMFISKRRMIAFGPFICLGYLLYIVSLYNNI